MAQVEQATSKKGKRYLTNTVVEYDEINANVANLGYIKADDIEAGTIQANKISGGTLTLGGANDANGVLQILNASGEVIGILDKSGILYFGIIKAEGYEATNARTTAQCYVDIDGFNVIYQNIYTDNYDPLVLRVDHNRATYILDGQLYKGTSILSTDSHNMAISVGTGNLLNCSNFYGEKLVQAYCDFQAEGYKSADGSTGVTTTCTVKVGGVDKTMTIKNGIITSIA